MEKIDRFSEDISKILKKIDTHEQLKGLYEEVEWNDMSIDVMNYLSKDIKPEYKLNGFQDSVELGIYLDEQEKELNSMYEKMQENYFVAADTINLLYQNITESIIEQTY